MLQKTLLAIAILVLSACTLPTQLNNQQQIETPAEGETTLPLPTLATPQQSSSAAYSSERIPPEALIYLGAFRLPQDPGWEYSGQGLAYSPQGDSDGDADSFPGSLFGVGFDQQLYVSEIDIPQPVISTNLEDLNTAVTIQPFTNLYAGLVDFEAYSIPVMGLAYLPPTGSSDAGSLYFCLADHLNDGLPTHGMASADLSSPGSEGLWHLGDFSNFTTCDYLFEIPESWSATFAPGMNLATGRFREGVWGGMGPALYAYQPSTETIQQATPLLLYGVQQENSLVIESNESTMMSTYMESDHWTGAAWLTSGEASAVIFAGTKALGRSWYGFANGVEWDHECAEQTPPTCPDVPDWPYDNRGYWAEDYQAQILFYDAGELGAVAQGNLETYSPQPYSNLDLTPYLFDPELNFGDYKRDLVGAIAFDREHGYLYLVERLADEYRPVIHVFQIMDNP